MNQKINLKQIQILTRVFPIKFIKINFNELTVYIDSKYIEMFLLFLKNHILFQYKVLTSIAGVDYPQKKYRFELVYDLLSIQYNNRLRVKIFVNSLNIVDSCELIFNSANWYECEIFDMFGIFFLNHSNLKRILTDYGFEGYPLRKDFPLSGFIELKYDDKKKLIVSEYIELAQEYRVFDFKSPWNKN